MPRIMSASPPGLPRRSITRPSNARNSSTARANGMAIDVIQMLKRMTPTRVPDGVWRSTASRCALSGGRLPTTTSSPIGTTRSTVTSRGAAPGDRTTRRTGDDGGPDNMRVIRRHARSMRPRSPAFALSTSDAVSASSICRISSPSRTGTRGSRTRVTSSPAVAIRTSNGGAPAPSSPSSSPDGVSNAKWDRPRRASMSRMAARCSSADAARSTRGRISSRSAFQSRPPNVGS